MARNTTPARTSATISEREKSHRMQDAQALAEALPHARLCVQKGLGHTRKLSPKLIAPVLVEFFEGV